MEPEQVLNSLRRAIKRRVDQLALNVTSGGVDSMETYKYIIGQINALESVQQEISNLLNDKEQNENRGTVINIGSKQIITPNKELVGLKKSEKKKLQTKKLNFLNLQVGEC